MIMIDRVVFGETDVEEREVEFSIDENCLVKRKKTFYLCHLKP